MDITFLTSCSHAYALFSDLFLAGITKTNVPIIQQLDELAQHLPQPVDLTQAAAAHQHVLGMNIFANESFFLDSSGMLGGEIADDVLASYQRVGYLAGHATSGGDRPSDHLSDHLGVELKLLAFLCGAQADALQDGQPAIALRMQREQQRFLQRHLLRWLAPCVIAIRQAGDPFYGALADLTLALAASHWQQITEMASGQRIKRDHMETVTPPDVDADLRLPQRPDLLGDQKTSLRDIAEFLLTPVYSGVYLSRDVITGLGRKQQLPRGFGERKLLLTNLLQSAAQYEQAQELLQALRDLAQHWRAAYAAITLESPPLAPFVDPWQQRAEQTHALLGQLLDQMLDQTTGTREPPN